FFFFFQAEDGIRDRTVTGVQTCALPIFALAGAPLTVTWSASMARRMTERLKSGAWDTTNWSRRVPSALRPTASSSRRGASGGDRSEERRVGKEGRSRGGRGD